MKSFNKTAVLFTTLILTLPALTTIASNAAIDALTAKTDTNVQVQKFEQVNYQIREFSKNACLDGNAKFDYIKYSYPLMKSVKKHIDFPKL